MLNDTRAILSYGMRSLFVMFVFYVTNVNGYVALLG